jgi:hypothetical protein
MAARKGWEQLSNTYRRRLKNNGITQSAYESGKSTSAARGHASTPEHAKVTLAVQGRTTVTRSYAAMGVRAGILDILPNFDTLSRAEQNRLGKLYIKSFFEKGTGAKLNKEQRTKRGLHPKDKRIARQAGDEQINGRIEFQEYVDENRDAWSSTDWKNFRTGYATFSTAA